MSEDSIKMSNLIMRILFESGLYSNADSICDHELMKFFESPSLIRKKVCYKRFRKLCIKIKTNV